MKTIIAALAMVCLAQATHAQDKKCCECTSKTTHSATHRINHTSKTAYVNPYQYLNAMPSPRPATNATLYPVMADVCTTREQKDIVVTECTATGKQPAQNSADVLIIRGEDSYTGQYPKVTGPIAPQGGNDAYRK